MVVWVTAFVLLFYCVVYVVLRCPVFAILFWWGGCCGGFFLGWSFLCLFVDLLYCLCLWLVILVNIVSCQLRVVDVFGYG